VASLSGRSLTLAGPGRAGRAFARSWSAAGGSIVQVLMRSPGSASVHGLPGAPRRSFEAELLESSDVLVLSVPDDRIESCAAALAGRLRTRFAFHLSGALTSDSLRALRTAGASVASLHPLRPFTGADDEDWTGAFVAVEGDPEASREGEEIARALSARPYRLSAEGKPLYHAAASLAAGGTLAVVSIAARLWAEAGLPEDVAREALATLAAQANEAATGASASFARAFTGAVARRDVGTVAAHARALVHRSDALVLYRTLAEEILARTPGLGREEEIRAILREPSARSNPRARGSA
jgi:predicted short-subunit dehydrogenase-like oxidoreductase (DUF2520 family)